MTAKLRASRFASEAAEEPFVNCIKKLTTKPAVGVGRFTSPDTMVRQVKSGILDLIGAARPSIADPFLPKKIEEGRIDEIRECIGCNICVAHDELGVPIRCTQNPTQGEEWRKDWHPERSTPKGDTENVLIIGAGPTGLEAANHLSARGYDVTLAEKGNELGGRVAREARLPNMATWGRVKDHREVLISPRPNVNIYLESELDADAVLDFGFERVAIATGSKWRRDGIARYHQQAIPGLVDRGCLTPDDLMDGKRVGTHYLIYDDDHYYHGSLMAELLAAEGNTVTYVTPAGIVSDWSVHALDQHRIHKNVIESCDKVHVNQALCEVKGGVAVLECVFTGALTETPFDTIVPVTARLPVDKLFLDLKARSKEWAAAGIKSVELIGDAYAPGTIAAAVYAGHKYARNLDEVIDRDAVPFKREMTALEGRS